MSQEPNHQRGETPRPLRPAPSTSASRSGLSEPTELAPGVLLDSWFAEELGNSSYLLRVEGSDTTVLIDPWRDADTYIPAIESAGSPRVLSLETHVHNDFISGSREVAASNQAEIGASKDAPLQYPHRPLTDGEEIPLGPLRLRVLATPGHTPEHLSYLLLGAESTPLALFSGGALIVGSAARTDLLGPLLARPLGVQLFKTLHDTLGKLPPSTRVFPTHGGGTFCGNGDPTRRTTTVGEELKANPLLRTTRLDDFLARILDQRPYPRYFARMRGENLQGAPLRGPQPFRVPSLTLDAFETARDRGALAIDLREHADFDAGHIPGTYAIGSGAAFSAWAGWLLPPNRPILFVDDDREDSDRAARQLFRIGYDAIAGRLEGGVATWSEASRPLSKIPRLSSRELARTIQTDSPFLVLDVREAYEYHRGHVPGAVNIPLGEVAARAAELPREVPIVVHCQHGYRSTAALSLLEQAGVTSLRHAYEGFAGWSALHRAG